MWPSWEAMKRGVAPVYTRGPNGGACIRNTHACTSGTHGHMHTAGAFWASRVHGPTSGSRFQGSVSRDRAFWFQGRGSGLRLSCFRASSPSFCLLVQGSEFRGLGQRVNRVLGSGCRLRGSSNPDDHLPPPAPTPNDLPGWPSHAPPPHTHHCGTPIPSLLKSPATARQAGRPSAVSAPLTVLAASTLACTPSRALSTPRWPSCAATKRGVDRSCIRMPMWGAGVGGGTHAGAQMHKKVFLTWSGDWCLPDDDRDGNRGPEPVGFCGWNQWVFAEIVSIFLPCHTVHRNMIY